MIDNVELENLKQVYLKLLEDINNIDNCVNNVLNNIENLSVFLKNYCSINDFSFDKGSVYKNKNDLNLVHNFLNNVVVDEISGLIIQINEKLNI